MNKLLLLTLSTSFYLPTFCQDILVLKNGDEIKVKVSEVLPDMVKYKKWDNQDGPIYSELKGNIFMIKYQNGSKDVFTNQGASNSNAPAVSNEEAMKNEAVKRLETSIVSDLKRRQKDQIIKVVTIQKTNGVMKNLGGQNVYTIYFDMTLEFIADGWLVGNMFEGFWQRLNVYPSEPNLAGSGQPYTTKKYPKGTVVVLVCEADMSKTDNGYKAGNLDIKNEKSVVQGVSTGNNSSQNQTNSNKPISNSTIANMINGNWYGNAFQKGVKKPFSIEFSCDLQKNEFKVNYPSAGCSGIWNIERSSDISIDFREHILTGRTACVEGGLVRLIFVNSNKLEGYYYLPNSTTITAKGEFTLKEKDTANLKTPIQETIKKDTSQETKTISSDIKVVILTSPTYVFGDVAHLYFKDNITHKEKEYEWDGDIPAIKEIMTKCEGHDGCPSLKGQAYIVTLKFKLLDIMEYDGESGSMKSTGKKEKRWIIIEVKNISNTTSQKASAKTTPPIEKSSSGGYNFDKHNDIKVFINDLAKAVSNNDRNTISQMINFPFRDTYGDNPGNGSEPLGCKTVKQFFEKYDKIFTNNLIKGITAKKYRGWNATDPKAAEEDYEPDDVIDKGEYLIYCFKDDGTGNRPCNMFGVKKVNGKFKIYAIKFIP